MVTAHSMPTIMVVIVKLKFPTRKACACYTVIVFTSVESIGIGKNRVRTKETTVHEL